MRLGIQKGVARSRPTALEVATCCPFLDGQPVLQNSTSIILAGAFAIIRIIFPAERERGALHGRLASERRAPAWQWATPNIPGQEGNNLIANAAVQFIQLETYFAVS